MTHSAMNDLLTNLNPEQIEAVTHGRGPQLVVAGAGTGKTAVITRRIAHLVNAKQCAAKNILALTFTDKAAQEMESRVDLLVPYGFTDSTICTFHAFGDKCLREFGFLLGLTPNYRVLSNSEQLIFLREHLFQLPLNRLRPLSNPTQHLQLILSIISRAKDEDVSPETYLNYCQQLEQRLDDESSPADHLIAEKQIEIAELYATYQRLLMQEGVVDFGDLITMTLTLLRSQPDVLADLQQRYQYILVDEFQDTNAGQFELIRLLAGEQANITVVGDDDQSIYKFRGAAISNILQFQKYYPQTKIKILTQNYRSTQFILDSSYTLIQHNNPERLEVLHQLNKRLHANGADGLPVSSMRFDTITSETDWVIQDLEKRKKDEQPTWGAFAILVRTKKEAEPFLQTMNIKNIPYRFSGNQGLYKRPEVRICVAFLKIVADPSHPLAFHELASSTLYDLPAEDLAYLAGLSKKTNQSMMALLKQSLAGQGKPLTPVGQEVGKLFLEASQHYLELAKRLSTGQVLYRFLSESGLISQYTAVNSIESDLAIKNIAKFFDVIKRYEYLAPSNKVLHFIQHLEMLEEIGDDPTISEIDTDVDAVNVMTVHRAKGLEFPVVYIVGCAANRFPAVNRNPSLQFPVELAKEDCPTQDQALAEERRLFYVAMTRAKETLVMTSAKDYGGKRQYKQSRFVMEALELPKTSEQVTMLTSLEKIKNFAAANQAVSLTLTPLADHETLILSYYQIEDYRSCPLKYKYNHILKIPVLPHHRVFYGNAIHAAIDTYYRQKKLTTQVEFELVKQSFLQAWVNQGFISEEHEQIRQQTGLAALQRFVEVENKRKTKTLYIEKSFSFYLGKNKITGRIDRVDRHVDGKVSIVDFKSSEILTQPDADKRAKDSLQLTIYALAWLELEKQLPAACQLYFVESGLIGSVAPNDETILKTRHLINHVADGIRQRCFEAKPDVWTCHFCVYRTICPAAAVK